MKVKEPRKRSLRAEIRDDVMRRLFAVAVSVGFATTLSKMLWLTEERLPRKEEFEHIAVLLTALFATVASWDGYLFSIRHKPLEKSLRFAIDIALVFIYMVLLLTSASPDIWPWMLSAIFSLYFLWDVLSIREYLGEYRENELPVGRFASAAQIARVYRDGLIGSSSVKKGPVITMMWWLYFSGLLLINNVTNATEKVFFLCLFAIIGLIIYRNDKMNPFRSRYRVLLISALLVLAQSSLLMKKWF